MKLGSGPLLVVACTLTSCTDSAGPTTPASQRTIRAADTEHREPAQLVFLSGRGGSGTDLWTVNTDGSGLVQLTSDGLDNQSPVGSPDGHVILYGSCVLPCPLPPPGAPDGIWTVRPDGGNPQRISAFRITGAGGAAWSPDGTRFVYGAATVPCDDDLRISTADGASDSLFIGGFPGVSESNTVLPAWATNNTIAFIGRSCGSPSGSVYLTNLSRSRLRRVTDGVWVDITADGQRLVIQRHRGNSIYDVWTSNVDGSHLTRLTFDANNVNPSWSPDGRWIAFVRGAEGSGRGNIWIMRADGSDLTQLTSGDFSDTEPKWLRGPRH
jgi:TolB protein